MALQPVTGLSRPSDRIRTKLQLELHGDPRWQILGGQEGADVRPQPRRWPGAVGLLGRASHLRWTLERHGPGPEWVRVYFWASDQVMRAHGKLPEGQTIWDVIDPKGELGTDRRELNDYERREYLDRLRRDIRRALVKHRKKREKTARRAR